MAMLTKAQQVEEYIRNGIVEGRWSVGERLPGEESMLSELRVSRSTFREALTSLSSDGIIVRKHGSGTYITSTPRVGTVTVLVQADALSLPMSHFPHAVIESARECMQVSGYRPVLEVAYGDATEELAASIRLSDKPILKETVGVLSYMSLGPLESWLEDSGIPSVAIEGMVATSKNVALLDSYGAMRMAADLLRSHGYGDFALMYFDYGGSSKQKLVEDIHITEICRMQKSLVEFDESRLISVPWSPNMEATYTIFKDWWARPNRPSSILFSDDSLFDVASRAILELGIKVPEELAIVTHANIGRQFHFPVQVTSVGYDPAETARIAWEILHRRINGTSANGNISMVPAHVQKGESLHR